MHPLPPDIFHEMPDSFTNPFRYFPHPLVVCAAKEVIARIGTSDDLHAAFSEGKMLGVLIVEIPGPRQHSRSKGRQAAVAEMPFSPAAPPHIIPEDTLHVIPGLTRNLHSNIQLGYLAAFSGSVGGRSHIEGFVPPIYDLLDPAGHFKTKEAEISAINCQIKSLEESSALTGLRLRLDEALKSRDEEISLMKARMAVSKRERDEIRSELSDPSHLAELIRESQFEKAELRRLKQNWDERIKALKAEVSCIESEISTLKALRSRMSDELQDWIFRQYTVHNSLGEESSVFDIFAAEGLVPPGGTGDCAAPKLLEYAFRNGLKPVAMGEFWYGKSPGTAVRAHGHFYPSCTSKCGPLLGWMVRGLRVSGGALCEGISPAGVDIIYEDEVLIAVDKPSGMPSVPGLDGRISAYEVVKRSHDGLFVVHRLDMDTSGILLLAKTSEAAVAIQKQFENHTIKKIYQARLSAEDSFVGPQGGADGRAVFELTAGARGRIELPLSPDYDERPRQKVDLAQGKTAITDYEVMGLLEDGSLDILFRPHTGRTHQLRVHSAHPLGLNRPIAGDPLYGGAPAPRLCLHAASITFLHPVTHQEITLHT